MTEQFNPGFIPLGYRVLLKPIEVEAKTSGGIILTDTAVEKDKARQQSAVIVAMGSVAFQHEVNGIMEDYPDKPKVGDKVRIIKYVGDNFLGDDGENYRLVNDRDILAVNK